MIKMFNWVQHHEAAAISANDITIQFDSFGDIDDPAIVLIMGMGTQLIHWDDDFCRFLASYKLRVIRFDNRDAGKSTLLNDSPVPSTLDFIGNTIFGRSLNAPYLLDDMAEDTLALMDGLDIKKAHIVGASMGGMIAQCVAIKASERVISLTSIMSTTGDRSLPKPKAHIGAKFLKPLSKDHENLVNQQIDMWRALHGDHFPFYENKVESIVRTAKERGFDPDGVARQLSAVIDSPDRTEHLKALSMPALVIHGDNDPLVRLESGIATAEALANSTFKVFKGMGHTLPDELWPEIIEEIIKLVRSTQ
ncbi:MAG: alpha/beta hydrolase [Pseudomonadota bacterium]